MKLTFPHPISANDYWRLGNIKGRPMIYKSSSAKQYQRDVAWIARSAGIKCTAGQVEIGAILLIPPAFTMRRINNKLQRVTNSRRMDIDNCLKVTFDALKGVLYDDDRQIERIRGPIEYGEPCDSGALIVEVLL